VTKALTAQISASRKASSIRSREGVRSSVGSWLRMPRGRSPTPGATADLNDGAGAEARELLRRARKPHPHRETLRHAHPVQRFLNIGNRAGQIDMLDVEHARSDAIDHAPDRLRAVDHRIDGRAVADMDLLQLRLAEIADREPLIRVDEREERL